MKQKVNHHAQLNDLWRQASKWPGSIKIDWLYIKDIPNTQFIHIENPLNENRPACQGRDCQEVYPKTGEKMLTVFESFKSSTKLFDDFMFYDEQEDLRKLKLSTVNMRRNYPSDQQQIPNMAQTKAQEHALNVMPVPKTL